jgi:hypothetical protein
MNNRYVSIGMLLALVLSFLGSVGCRTNYVNDAARRGLVSFVTDIVGEGLNASLFPDQYD